MVNFTVTDQGRLTLRPGVRAPHLPFGFDTRDQEIRGLWAGFLEREELLAVATSPAGGVWGQRRLHPNLPAGGRGDLWRRRCCPGPLGPRRPGSSSSPFAGALRPVGPGVCADFPRRHFHRRCSRLPGAERGALCAAGGDGGPVLPGRHGAGAGEPAHRPAADFLLCRWLRRLSTAGGGGGSGVGPGKRGRLWRAPASTPSPGCIHSVGLRRRERTTWRSPIWRPPRTGPGFWGCGVPRFTTGTRTPGSSSMEMAATPAFTPV